MASSVIEKATIYENSSVSFLARIRISSGSYLSQGVTDSITCKVFSLADTSTAVATPSITVSSVVFNSLQTSDDCWTKDTTGYNFKVTLNDSIFVDGDLTYQVEFKFALSNGNDIYVVYRVYTLPVYSE